MTANDYIDYDPSTTKFSISEEHAKVLCDRDTSAYTIPFVYWIPNLLPAIAAVTTTVDYFLASKSV